MEGLAAISLEVRICLVMGSKVEWRRNSPPCLFNGLNVWLRVSCAAWVQIPEDDIIRPRRPSLTKREGNTRKKEVLYECR